MNYFHPVSYIFYESRCIFSSQRKKPKEKKHIALPDLLSDEPKLETLGNREIIIEGCKGIAEYGENLIKLNTKTLVIGFSGTDLLIQSFDNGVAIIKGVISEITFVT